ncbi:AEC family transporter [Rhodovibrio salinarum]|uniref:AEC family transporter n=1 Tax=Rhodovibrio salinarum TaxID=1087 RepID=A0A934V0C8_9PROT|nr:AEC family transporter [Rhodovibrio salinarum]MBK1697663.1 hypothetical protein [Rhodovibrio salinarum]
MSILLDIIIPVFGLVGFGYLAGRLGLFDQARVRGLSSFAFTFAIPALLFRSMAQMDLAGSVAWPFLLSYYIAAVTMFAVGAVASRLVFARTVAESGIGGLCSSYSNAVLLGIPLLLTAFGERASLPAFLMVAFHSALMFPLVTVVIEIGRGQGERLREIPIATARGLVRNPILWGLGMGLLWNATGWPLPDTLESLLKTLGRAAVPVALFAMGASLVGYRMGRLPLEPLTLSAFKLIAMPALVFVLGSYVFSLDPLWLEVAVVMAALPAGVNVYVLGQQYDANGEGAAATVLLSTALSLVTVSALLFLFQVR